MCDGLCYFCDMKIGVGEALEMAKHYCLYAYIVIIDTLVAKLITDSSIQFNMFLLCRPDRSALPSQHTYSSPLSMHFKSLNKRPLFRFSGLPIQCRRKDTDLLIIKGSQRRHLSVFSKEATVTLPG